MYKQDYPVFLDLKERCVIVAGGAETALRKLRRLNSSNALVTVIAAQISAPVTALCRKHGYPCHERELCDTDLQDTQLVFAASDNTEHNIRLANLAHQHGCFVNVANRPDLSSFLVPSLIDRSPLLIAVSSTGSSPVLARLLTARIEAFIPHTYRELGLLADQYKERIKQLIPQWRKRRRFWEKLLNSHISELMLQGRHAQARQAMDQALDHYETDDQSQGEVYLVGAGPGDPDLLTFRALRLMQQCDIVLYDRLVSESIMALVNPDAQRIYVGKQRDQHAVPQPQINEQLADLAEQGHKVLRLKGGDPFMFGRGGEEIETLAEREISFQVVPGITSATGCSAYAGIPLTHRDYAQSCTFITGHLKDGSVNLDWQALTRPGQTVVIYMGLVGLPVICKQLIAHGLSAKHPIALVSQGTRHNQQVLSGTLQSLPAMVKEHDIKAPTLIIVGEVVTLRHKLAWFEPHTSG